MEVHARAFAIILAAAILDKVYNQLDGLPVSYLANCRNRQESEGEQSGKSQHEGL